MEANVAFALARNDLRDGMVEMLKKYVGTN